MRCKLHWAIISYMSRKYGYNTMSVRAYLVDQYFSCNLPLNLWYTHEEKGSISYIKLFTIKGKAKRDSTLVITKRCLLGFAYSNVPAQIIWFFMMISTEQADLQTTDSVLVFTRGAVLVLFGLLTLLELGGTTTVIFL